MNKTAKESRVRLIDVAARVGVSRAAVARVLLGTGGEGVRVSEETATRIRETAAEMGYRPNQAARQLKGVRSGLVGVLVDTDNRAVMNDRLVAIERAASRRGYRLMVGWVHQSADSMQDYLTDFQDRGVEGLVCLFDVTDRRDSLLRQLIPANLNTVFHGRPLRRGDRHVRVDTHRAVQQLVRHLAAGGRRRIGIELWNLDDQLMRIRRQAYLETLEALEVAMDERLIWSAGEGRESFTDQAVKDALEALVLQGRADAVIASNDIWGVRFIQDLKQRGLRVPQDVAVTGYDNLEISTVIDPPLTTIDQQHDEYAEAMLDILMGRFSGGQEAVIAPALIVRESSAMRT